jgi:ABC-type nitrate/sulfonate/bicarbonate transport system substrate-binding protein
MLRRDLLRHGLAAGAVASFAGTASSATKLERVNIVCTYGTTQLVLSALIKKMGYFAQFGLVPNIVNVADGSKVVAALISGQMDICPTSGFTQVLAGIEKGLPLKIIAGGATKNFNALFSGNPAVKTLKDLEGRTVGVGALGSQLHQIMIALLRKYGVDSAKVTFVNVGASTDVFRAVAARTVDAGCAEYWLQRNAPDLHIVEHGKTFESLPEFINQAAFTSERAIAQKRDLLVRTLAAYAKAYRFIMSGDSESAFVAASATGLGRDDPDFARAQWKFWRDIQPFAADLILREDQIRFMQDLNVATGTQKKMVPYAKLADMSMAQDALKLLAR